MIEQLPCAQVVTVIIVVERAVDNPEIPDIERPEDSVDSNDVLDDLDVVSGIDELKLSELGCTIELDSFDEDEDSELGGLGLELGGPELGGPELGGSELGGSELGGSDEEGGSELGGPDEEGGSELCGGELGGGELGGGGGGAQPQSQQNCLMP